MRFVIKVTRRSYEKVKNNKNKSSRKWMMSQTLVTLKFKEHHWQLMSVN